jgi:hypothetical protein
MNGGQHPHEMIELKASTNGIPSVLSVSVLRRWTTDLCGNAYRHSEN